jgi:hypothetical protein
MKSPRERWMWPILDQRERNKLTRLDQVPDCNPLLTPTPLIPLPFCLLCCSCACLVMSSISSKGGMLILGVALFFSCYRPTYLCPLFTHEKWLMVWLFFSQKLSVYILLQILHVNAFSVQKSIVITHWKGHANPRLITNCLRKSNCN